MTPKKETPTVRERVRALLEDRYDSSIAGLLEQAFTAEKETWITCKHCKHRNLVQTADWNARMRGLEIAMNQALGRPGSDEEDRVVELRVIRVWPGPVSPPDWKPDDLTEARLLELGWSPPE